MTSPQPRLPSPTNAHTLRSRATNAHVAVPTPIPVRVVNPASNDPTALYSLLAAIVAAVVAVSATVAGILAAVYAKRTYDRIFAKPDLAFAYQDSAIVFELHNKDLIGQRRKFNIDVTLKNTGATVESVYVDLWLFEPAKINEPRIVPNKTLQVRKWTQEETVMLEDGGPSTRYSAYFGQHIPGNGTTVTVGTFDAHVQNVDATYDVFYRLRSTDGSVFPPHETGLLVFSTIVKIGE